MKKEQDQQQQYCLQCKTITLLIDRVVIDKYLKGKCEKCGKPIIVLLRNNKEPVHVYNQDQKV